MDRVKECSECASEYSTSIESCQNREETHRLLMCWRSSLFLSRIFVFVAAASAERRTADSHERICELSHNTHADMATMRAAP